MICRHHRTRKTGPPHYMMAQSKSLLMGMGSPVGAVRVNVVKSCRAWTVPSSRGVTTCNETGDNKPPPDWGKLKTSYSGTQCFMDLSRMKVWQNCQPTQPHKIRQKKLTLTFSFYILGHIPFFPSRTSSSISIYLLPR